MRTAVYLRLDQWMLVDQLLASAAAIIGKDAETDKDKMFQPMRPASRVALRWSNLRIAEIRQEISKRVEGG
jgi:hypothetical protein